MFVKKIGGAVVGTVIYLIILTVMFVAMCICCCHSFIKNKKDSSVSVNNVQHAFATHEEEVIPKVKFYYKNPISKPVKKIYSDAGWDLTTPNDFQLAPGESILIDTNVIADIPENYVGILKSRSGLACKFRIDTANAGVIDSSYRGNIKVLLENRGDTEYIAKAGDRICQMLVLFCLLNAEFIEGEPNDQTERGKNGFGSSGK